ncbi:DUF2891 family protein [Brachybacterium subflavum]|uniref:DUF2891 family protein n=1 Tax=Brachybacterium subflavum TaxID=2585206 RepID=UPI0012665DE0|nr:DUF2891 family protein [Brachybacterium subflavum]
MNTIAHSGVPAGAPIDALAAVAMANLSRPYPFAAHHVQTSAEDLHQPALMHPAFASSFDWHSSVHMHWLLASLVEATAASSWREQALELLADHLAPQKLAAEAAYLRENPTWERPYGWAWAAQLVMALGEARTPELRSLAGAAAPLLDDVLALVRSWLPRTPLPVRHGLHTNTAFGLRRVLRAARATAADEASDEIEQAARRFFLEDADWAFDQERSGQDFLSAGLSEADLMIEVLDEDELAAWLPRFLSRLHPGSEVLRPVPVIDPSDGYQSHLDGLGLTAAASGLRIADALERIASQDCREITAALRDAAPPLMEPGLRSAVSEEYMASHWLATFAWEAHLALASRTR